jgi:hypothetical protein
MQYCAQIKMARIADTPLPDPSAPALELFIRRTIFGTNELICLFVKQVAGGNPPLLDAAFLKTCEIS